MLKDSDRYHIDSHHPFSDLAVFGNAALPWSSDGALDPSLFQYECSVDGSFIW
jgi:hypothetical protein